MNPGHLEEPSLTVGLLPPDPDRPLTYQIRALTPCMIGCYGQLGITVIESWRGQIGVES